ncbi:MAG: hypothetical protein GY852_04880 [bacterium]|nr:hypothetical protein [bacterium]
MKALKGKFVTGKPVTKGFGAKPIHIALFYTFPLVFSFAISTIYQGMRFVMFLGGFVARGGPYEIAHPAPDWIWIFPVSMFLLMFSLFGSLAVSAKTRGPNLMSLSWSAIFLSLGWNFTQLGFGIGISAGEGLIFSWVICALLFIPMGLIPLIFIIKSFYESLSDLDETKDEQEHPSWKVSLLLQCFLSAAGIRLAVLFFRFLQ